MEDISEIATWRVEMPRNRNLRHVKSQNVEIRNVKMIKASLAKLLFHSFRDPNLESQDASQ
jgi:hypothetical protein